MKKEDEIEKMVNEKYPLCAGNDNTAKEFNKMVVIARLAFKVGYAVAVDGRLERAMEALEEIATDHYPESVFKPMSEDEWAEFVKYVQRKYTIDAISGYYGRFFHKIHRDIAQKALKEISRTPVT